jgi:hypothetical protein
MECLLERAAGIDSGIHRPQTMWVDRGDVAVVNGGFALGLVLGAAIGVASGNFGIGLALGVALGFAFAAAARKKLKSED